VRGGGDVKDVWEEETRMNTTQELLEMIKAALAAGYGRGRG
jgi:hypothetical protein